MDLEIAEQRVGTAWHFPLMILVSLFIFYFIIRIVVGKERFYNKLKPISILALFVVVIGMIFGKYGAQVGLPWWIYYPVPMLMTVLLPPYILRMDFRKTVLYLLLSFLSAPVIHALFSFFLGWTEYMPFWKIPFIGDL